MYRNLSSETQRLGVKRLEILPKLSSCVDSETPLLPDCLVRAVAQTVCGDKIQVELNF